MRNIGGIQVENGVKFIIADSHCVMKEHIVRWQIHHNSVELVMSAGDSVALYTEEPNKLNSFIAECMLLGGY